MSCYSIKDKQQILQLLLQDAERTDSPVQAGLDLTSYLSTCFNPFLKRCQTSTLRCTFHTSTAGGRSMPWAGINQGMLLCSTQQQNLKISSLLNIGHFFFSHHVLFSQLLLLLTGGKSRYKNKKHKTQLTKELSSVCKAFYKGDFHPIYTEDFQASNNSFKASW